MWDSSSDAGAPHLHDCLGDAPPSVRGAMIGVIMVITARHQCRLPRQCRVNPRGLRAAVATPPAHLQQHLLVVMGVVEGRCVPIVGRGGIGEWAQSAHSGGMQ